MKQLRKPARSRLALTTTAIIALGAASLASGQPGPAVEEIVVFGRSTDLVGVAPAATEGTIGGADLLIRPLFKTSELLESMPGMVAVQHSGSGKANQYFLRGFNLDHGTDYTAYLDGMPLNLRSHGHGQGYLDVNGLIPETVESIDYRKGPYRADIGDFSLAGASFIHTIDRLENAFISGEAGDDHWGRIAGGMSADISDGALSLVGEYKTYDGPWEHGEHLRHVSVWGKYFTNTRFGEAEITLSGYEADWEPTEQIPERAIGTSVCADAFCALDPTATGTTSRWIANGGFTGNDWQANLYAQHYDWEMISNPTYDFQINQFDKRWTIGGHADKTLVDNGIFELIAGGDFRHDDVSRVGLDEYVDGQFVSNIGANEIRESSVGVFSEVVWYASDMLRLMGGLRGDFYDFDVAAINPTSFAGQESETQVSPKLGVAISATRDIELYGNWGRGFHSNDARGAVNSVEPVPGLSEGTGYEAGARLAFGDFLVTAAYWWLDQDSELIFVGDANSVEPKGGSERDGLELTMFWQPREWLGIDAVYTSSDAHYTENPEGKYVEGAVEEAGQIGISATRDDWDASLRLRYLGAYALTADNSQRAQSMTTVSLRGARHWDALTVYAEVINLFDSDGKEIVYYYPAWVEGLDPAGQTSDDIDCSVTNCRMSRATVPQSLRLGVSYRF